MLHGDQPVSAQPPGEPGAGHAGSLSTSRYLPSHGHSLGYFLQVARLAVWPLRMGLSHTFDLA